MPPAIKEIDGTGADMTEVSRNAIGRAPADAPGSGARTAGVRILIGIQLYTVVAYLAAAIIPYLWRHHPAPPTWTWIVPGWLLGVPGFWITIFGPVLALPLAVVGTVVLVRRRHTLPARLYRWCVAATVLAVAYALFTLTPLGWTIADWVAD
jgi:hypothetical protein